MFKQDRTEQAQDRNIADWFDTPDRKRARSRNWALYLARGMYTQTYWFRGILSPFGYRCMCDALRDVIFELEQQYPNSPGPKTISRRSRSH